MIGSAGAVLALVLAAGGQDHNGTNGFRPGDLFLLEISPGTLFGVDWRESANFEKWLAEDPAARRPGAPRAAGARATPANRPVPAARAAPGRAGSPACRFR